MISFSCKARRSFACILSIDGFNETNASKNGGSIIAPTPTYDQLINSPYSRSFILRVVLASTVRSFFEDTPVVQNSFLGFLVQQRIVGELVRRLRATSIQDIKSKLYFQQFRSPPGEPAEKSLLYNREKYEIFIRANDAVAKSLGVRYAHFLQPIPAFKLFLTDQEKASPLLTTKEQYQNLMEAIRELRDAGLPAFSLVDIFRDVRSTIFSDSIHCGRSHGDYPGYRIMADEIGKRLTVAWGLKKRS
jgi:hypothetical protein